MKKNYPVGIGSNARANANKRGQIASSPPKSRRAKTRSVSKAKKIAWHWFSKYIRLRDADKNGFSRCVTCGLMRSWDKLQAGHFIPGRKNAVLYCEIGVNSQCYVCNITLKGRWPEYMRFMTDKYGHETVNKLLERSRSVVQMSAVDHMEVAEKYQEKFNSLFNERTRQC